MHADHPIVEAMAIDRESGKIIATGSAKDVQTTIGIYSAVTTYDLQGKTVLPGLIDAHTHIFSAACASIEIDLSSCQSEAMAADLVGERAATTPKGEWIVGRHWNQNHWPGAAFPTRASLDAVTPDHPVALWTHSEHAIWINSLALQRAGISAATIDPAGGQISRDDTGEPTGMLFEGAAWVIAAILAAENESNERSLEATYQLMAAFAERGLTMVYTMEGERSLKMLQKLRGRYGALPVRVGYYVPVNQLESLLSLGIEAGFGDEYMWLSGIKIFMDGALGTRTAAMLAPFNDDYTNKGLLTTPADMLERYLAGAIRGNLGVAIHAIGDRAVRVAIDGIEEAQNRREQQQPLRRFRIEHVQLADQVDLTRMARLGIAASVQPFHAVSDRTIADTLWGARAATGYAYGTMAKMGIPLALGSDTPIETADPWRILHAAIARTDDVTPMLPPWHVGQALTPSQALLGYTAGAAWSGGDEHRFGRLIPGHYGDCVIIATDPLHTTINEWPTLPIQATIMGGKVTAGKL